MRLNTIKPAAGSKKPKRRVARGIGSGLGKTAGRGHKGQKSRSGGFHKVGFEGGQMPLQRRLPKRGFVSMSRDDTAEVRLADLARLPVVEIDLLVLKAAWMMDVAGNKVAKTEIAMIKVVAPTMACEVIDWAIQAHGGGGVSNDFPLAFSYAQARTLRFADGPDEVHRASIAKMELGKYAPPKAH